MTASRTATAAAPVTADPTAPVTVPAAAPSPAADAGRPPTLHQKIDGAATAHREVARGAGAGRKP